MSSAKSASNPNLTLLLGFACNNRCRFCTVTRMGGRREKTTGEIREAMKRYPLRQRISFSGGEPTIRKDIFELASYARELGYKNISVETNGRMLGYKNFTENLLDSGVNTFVVSLLGDNAAVHDNLTQVEGSFEQALQGIKNARSLGARVMIHFVLVKQNYRKLPGIVNFLLDLDVEHVRIMLCHPTGDSYTFFHELVPRIKTTVPFLKKALDIGIRRKKTVVIDNFPFCILKGYDEYFTSFSRNFRKVAQFTPQKGMGSMFTDRINETVKIPGCKKCRFDKICDGLFRKYGEEYGLAELRPVP